MKYEINDETLAIIPIGNSQARVFEVNDEYVFEDTPYSIMENSCRYFGSSLDGRLLGSKDILGNVYKIPIIVEESQRLIFFPTEAISSPSVSWISYHNVKCIEKQGENTLIKFKNGEELVVNCPYFSVKNQIFRCNMLDAIFYSRKNSKKND